MRAISWTIFLVTFFWLIALYALFQGSSFVFDATLAGILVILGYYHRERFLLSVSGAFLVLVGICMNLSGLLGAYDITFLGIGWDKYIHLVTMAGIFFLVYAFLRKNTLFHMRLIMFLAALVTMGFGAWNEVNEFTGSRMLGINEGMLAVQNGATITSMDAGDPYWDMVFNLVGIIIAVLALCIKELTTIALAKSRGRPQARRARGRRL